MGEQNRTGLSISFRMDDGVVEHNNRHFVAKNVDRTRISDNVTYKAENLRSFYNELFGQALADFNARQKRRDRIIPDYYEHIRKGKQEKLYNEIVVQFGDMKDCGVGSENWETAKAMLNEYMSEFEKRNPNLKVFNAVMHLDEATPHLHIDFVPVAHSANRGLSTKVSMKGALREQGFTSANRLENEYTAWSERERGFMEQILRKFKMHREDKNVHRAHLSVDEYKYKMQQAQEIQKLNSHINELKKKSDSSYNPEEITLIKNQNDYLRGEITKRDEKLSALEKQVGSPFVAFEIFSEDKLQYVADGLTKAKIPFVEDSFVLHIPEYAVKTANAISSHYKSSSVGTIREQISLDIDRLIYSSSDFESLLSKLKERGYEIKRGKHLAVKAPFAERFVRLKSLGDNYLPPELEKRIAEKEKFPNSVRRKISKCSEIEKKVCVTILETTVAIQQLRIIPRKTKPNKIYVYQNDETINRLAEQLRTISELDISSRDGIMNKISELKESIDRKNDEIKSLSDELPTLKSDIRQLHFFFSNLQNRRKLDTMGQIKMSAAKEIAEKYGVRSEDDIAELEKRLKLIPTYVSSLKKSVSEEQAQLNRVAELSDIYDKIVDGNYIDNLVREQKEIERKLSKN